MRPDAELRVAEPFGALVALRQRFPGGLERSGGDDPRRRRRRRRGSDWHSRHGRSLAGDPFRHEVLCRKIAHGAREFHFVAGQLPLVFNPDFRVTIRNGEGLDKGDRIAVELHLLQLDRSLLFHAVPLRGCRNRAVRAGLEFVDVFLHAHLGVELRGPFAVDAGGARPCRRGKNHQDSNDEHEGCFHGITSFFRCGCGTSIDSPQQQRIRVNP